MLSRADYLKEVLEIAKELSRDSLDKFCDDLIQLGNEFSAQDVARITQQINQPAARVKLLKILSVGEMAYQRITPLGLSWSLRTACIGEEVARSEEDIELVWTGPVSASSAMRRTDQVLLDLINEARETILIVTFAAYKVPSIAKALAKAAERGVRIDLVLESAEESDGKLTFNGIKALGANMVNQSNLYLWPLDQREHDENGHYGSLHTKCAVIDSESVFVSSANLTDYALTLNMELGIVINGGAMPQKIQAHFEFLISDGILRKIN